MELFAVLLPADPHGDSEPGAGFAAKRDDDAFGPTVFGGRGAGGLWLAAEKGVGDGVGFLDCSTRKRTEKRRDDKESVPRNHRDQELSSSIRAKVR